MHHALLRDAPRISHSIKIVVRQPILNKIIKIGYRTVHFSLIFRAFSTCQFYGTKAKLLKTEEGKNRPVTLYRPVIIIICGNTCLIYMLFLHTQSAYYKVIFLDFDQAVVLHFTQFF